MNSARCTYLDDLATPALAAALENYRNAQPRPALLVLLCERDAGAVGALQEIANRSGLPLVGAIVPGLVVDGNFRRQGALLMRFDANLPYRIVPLPHEDNRTLDTAIGLLTNFVVGHASRGESDTLLMFVDAMTPDVASLLDRLYLEVGDQVRYAGTSVGSETFQPVPCLFDNHSLVEEAALVLLLPHHPGAVLAHHYSANAMLRVATATAGNRIGTIDGIPAFDAYRELIADTYGDQLTRENFYHYGVHYPFAIFLADGEPLVRIPVAVEPDGAVFCVGEVPENAMLSVVEAIAPGDVSAARQVAAEARAIGGDTMLTFYCAGRLLHLGEQAAGEELAVLAGELAPAGVYGLLSLGEIGCARQNGYPRFHNTTIVAIPWP